MDYSGIFDSFCRSINGRVILYSNILERDSLDISFVGSFAEFVYLWLACVAGSCELNWADAVRCLQPELGGCKKF